MRILIITDSYRRLSHIGGGDLIGQKLERGLSSKGHTLAVATSRGAGYTEEKVLGVHRIFLRGEDLRNLSRRQLLAEIEAEKRSLDALVDEFQPDVLLGLQQADLAVPIVAHINALPVRKVYRIGGDWLFQSYLGRMSCPYSARRYPLRRSAMALAKRIPYALPAYRLFPRLPFQAERVIFNSRDLLERHRPITNGESESMVIRNGVDGDHFSYREKKPGRPLRILFVGRLIPRKGAHVLMDALSHLRAMEGLPDTTLTLIGAAHNPRYLQKLKQRMTDRGLRQVVDYHSVVPQAELPDAYHAHDLLVFPSLHRRPQERGEGCPSVLLEAMACGLPIAARMGPGMDEILEHEKNCVAVHSDDPVDLAHSIAELARDKEMYHKLQRQGRAYVEQHHSMDRMITAVEDQLIGAAAIAPVTLCHG